MTLVAYVGGAESDTFITIAEAEAYFEKINADTSDWLEYSDEEKEFRIQLAAQMLGHLPLRGRMVFHNQSLCFPRTCQLYSGRFKIPPEVKNAQALIALLFIPDEVVSLRNTGSYGSPSSVNVAGLLSVSFGNKSGVTSVLERFTSQVPLPVYMLMKKFMTQIRGGAIKNLDESFTLSTTTSHPPITTTTSA
jgi:hypothetical protein